MAVASVPDHAEYGGYDLTFTKPILEKFQCSICTKVLRDPHLTGCCGQHYCESCLNHWLKKQNKTTCPHCRHENFIHILNKERKREVHELEVQCTKKEMGCQWVGELGNLQPHLYSAKGCGYIEVQCSNKCGKKMQRKELDAHLSQRCPLRKIKCQYCPYEDTYKTITNQHYKKCPCYPLPCPNYCGTTGIRRADMDNHRSKCELEPVKCPFHEAGCTTRVVRKEFDTHMSGSQQNHLLVLLGAFQETKRNLHNTTLKLLETRHELEESKAKQGEIKTLKHSEDEVTFCMTNFSLYQQTGKVWHSPPFYYNDGYKLCLAVHANGKGAGAGTHVSVELLQMRGEQDDKLKWIEEGQYLLHPFQSISIQVMTQSNEAQSQEKQHSLERHMCSKCFTHLPPHVDHRVCQSRGNKRISNDKFIDHKSVEQLLNDTIILKLSTHYTVF